ncbi:MAG TPA: hypothetical protein VFA41_18305 [Ktedonobacteraceae bacterium]|jgi:hypothetical protein|nr:hypothetical protein [Ktedonobacteraceae bacterium]
MLAYIFWHRRAPHVDKTTYQHYLQDFHEVLLTQQPAGFHYSTVFELSQAPWLPGGEEAYEDWYVLENSAALDVINEIAVTGPCKAPHNRAAQGAAVGAGGLYRLYDGETKLATARIALCFAKPAGMSYETLYALLQSIVDMPQVSLWRRQMVLGPAPEFRLHSPQPLTLPEPLHPVQIELTQVWPKA